MIPRGSKVYPRRRRSPAFVLLVVMAFVASTLIGYQAALDGGFVFFQGSETKIDRLPSKVICDNLSLKYNLRNMDSMTGEDCQGFKKHCGLKDCNAMLDVVFLWVNGSDPQWKSERDTVWRNVNRDDDHIASKANIDARYRDFGQLRFGLRSIEKNLPFARRIFIVTKNQIPSYVDKNNPQIRLVNHNSLKPDIYRQYPLYNTVAISIMLSSIPTISAPFLYLEDDMFIGRKAKIEDFFRNNRSVYDNTITIPYTPSNIDFVNTTKQIRKKIIALQWLQSKGYDLSPFMRLRNNYTGDTTLLVETAGHFGKMVEPILDEKLWELFPQEMSQILHHPFRHFKDPMYWSLLAFADPNGKYYEYTSTPSYYAYMTADNIDEIRYQLVSPAKRRQIDSAKENAALEDLDDDDEEGEDDGEDDGGDQDNNNNNNNNDDDDDGDDDDQSSNGYLMICLNDGFNSHTFTKQIQRKVDELYLELFPERSAFELEPLRTHEGPPVIDGGWTMWKKFGRCIKGKQTRRRYCRNPRPSNGGKKCKGTGYDTRPC